jgi:hypothetical protein
MMLALLASAFLAMGTLPDAFAGALAMAGTWQYTAGDRPPQVVSADVTGEAEVQFEFPGSATVYLERERKTLRPDPAEFQAGSLEMAVQLLNPPPQPIRGSLFVKDKDGRWFQGQTEFTLGPGSEWRTLRVDLTAEARDLRPLGHEAAWSSLQAVTIHTVGISLYGAPDMTVALRCRLPSFTGTRIRPALNIHGWQCPKRMEAHERIESRFALSREYFNPFDPEEIRVDVEVVTPGGAGRTWPAFLSQDYRRELQVNREVVTPVGQPFWAFRFTPVEPGIHRLRLTIEDNSEDAPVRLTSPWQRIEVAPSTRPGFVRVCVADNRYFEKSTGEFFYPIGFNLHTVKDVRSEQKLGFGYLPDRGTYSYESYLDAMAKNGVNTVEIWMAAWSFAIEWTSAQSGYFGLGRYNLGNAWRLDHVLEHAREREVYVHLVLDNHGKLSSHCDPEWDDAPHNRKNPFAVADGATIDRPVDFFSDAPSQRYYRQRNRYIAGRWGGQVNLLGMELLSELDLITDCRQAYDNNVLIDWHVAAVRQLWEQNLGPLLITTHTCGDFNNNIRHRKLFDLPEIAYVVGDAYRNETPFVDHMRQHINTLRGQFHKPLLVTEYGGSPQGASMKRLAADLHAGIWSSLFMEQAGVPFLWWHDFIHRKGQYPHFLGFSRFLADVDPRGKKFVFGTVPVQGPGDQPDGARSCLTAGNRDEHYAWVFDRQLMTEYPETPAGVAELAALEGRRIVVEGMGEGTFLASFHDTLSGEKVGQVLATPAQGGKLVLDLPPFRADLAVKIRRETGTGGLLPIIDVGEKKP